MDVAVIVFGYYFTKGYSITRMILTVKIVPIAAEEALSHIVNAQTYKVEKQNV